MEYATTLDRTAGTSASDSKPSAYSTSTARSAAPSGVRNTAAMPAATPATSRMRRSADAQLEEIRDERTERSADLHRRTFTTTGAAGAERQERRDALDPDDALADDATLMMKRANHRVATAAARFRREPCQEAAREAAERRQDEQEPGPERVKAAAVEQALAVGTQRDVPREAFQEIPLHELEARKEQRAREPCENPDERRVKERAPDDAKIERRRLCEDQRQERAVPRRDPNAASGPDIQDARAHGRSKGSAAHYRPEPRPRKRTLLLHSRGRPFRARVTLMVRISCRIARTSPASSWCLASSACSNTHGAPRAITEAGADGARASGGMGGVTSSAGGATSDGGAGNLDAAVGGAVDEVTFTRADVAMASSRGDDGPRETTTFLRGKHGGYTYPDASLHCLASATHGCSEIGACLGLSPEKTDGGTGTCDGNVALLRTGRWDCSTVHATCQSGTCVAPGATLCSTGSTPSSCDSEGRPNDCEKVVQVGPVCASLGLVCDATDTSNAYCRGTGDNCLGSDVTYFDVAPLGTACSGDTLSACVGGKTADLDCRKLGDGFTCQKSDGAFFCGLASECDPQTFGKQCDGATVVFCDAGKLVRVDCTSLGLASCDATSTSMCSP